MSGINYDDWIENFPQLPEGPFGPREYVETEDGGVRPARNMMEVTARRMNKKPFPFEIAQGDIGKFYVSTVFTGINYQFVDSGPPICYETRVECGDWEMTRRYGSRKEATEKDAVIRELIRNALNIGMTHRQIQRQLRNLDL